ncbi:LPS export ABC transporter periplasmic protein LptC [Qipengyuania sp. DY56-A-20]|jgi:lipopolysaccharide export system protein LptC|uniref:LPS export ABC transporter periplasmic protein LptC n=1 Tax=Qipengyuania benthica TaxID=3067651 RepID=A0ABT9H4F1_9SPHN|nr:LPS export ABC transporter periplasmic protein LptC [Qipengyuania sp. DY56-A-20]MBU1253100.1 LPS export ABC transporter periplasmic protein LptC [Alphaproteobacteria bacterium]MBU1605491.1 LPS export ABC transporter periplasmic protein LptC [Alphaproteobacteria bacterium]MDP4538199.1 LPS export ABC transporter periplasmic protein LptC [Qipengyuania sp. DY56-A-20]
MVSTPRPEKRRETRRAAALRSRRQHFAAPGGSHDRLVGFLARALPLGVGVVAALMVITPLSPRGEVSFLLDRNKVAVIDERLRVDNAMYRGQDDRSRPFSVTAGEAVQKSSLEGIVRMADMEARLLLPEGPAVIDASGGAYDIDAETMIVPGTMRMIAADGYRMLLRDVLIDLDTRRVVGRDGVSGAIPAGTFSANRLEVDLAARTVALVGDARLRMVPGQLRMP